MPLTTCVSKKDSPTGVEITTSEYFASSVSEVSQKQKLNQLSTSRTKLATIPPMQNNMKDETLLDDIERLNDIHSTDLKAKDKVEDVSHIEILSDDDDKEILTKKNYIKSKSTTSKKGNNKRIGAKKVHQEDSIDISTGNKDVSSASNPYPRHDDTHPGLRNSEDEDIKLVKSIKPKPSTTSKKSLPHKDAEPETSSVKAILDSISTIRAPTPPPKDPNAKWSWKSAQTGGNNGPPPAAGSKEIPVGKENCLVGLSFVFTGLLDTLSRDEAQELVKRYGGRVTIAPSRKTSFVVLGSDAGPSKLRKIQELSLKTINEDGLLELLRIMPANGGDSKAAEMSIKKQELEMEKVIRDAEEMEREENQKIREAEMVVKLAPSQQKSSAHLIPRPVASSSQLWTTKFAPTSINQICGNKSSVEKIQNWLKGWPLAHKHKFQRRGPDGLGGYRAIIIHGPPGIGKTTAAHLAAKSSGYDILESNASDTRSKKLVEAGLSEVLNNNSLLGYFAGREKDVDEQKKKIVLIMDEVDGMSAGDRGGVGALAQVCKKTDIPMILICNDRRLPKMKPFDFVTYEIPFRRPTVDQIRSRIATICHREGLKIPTSVIDALIEGSNKDIRQVINMISAIKLDQKSMDYEQGKEMTKAWEKHIVLKPWDICHKLLSGGLFSPSSKATLNDKIELYFNDHEFSYLMIQENYLRTKPLLANGQGSLNARLKALQLSDDAAQSISDGDLVDRMIHGSQQQWSLMPTHAVFSAVRPASFVAGMMTGQTSFTQWLGNNSKQQKLVRYVKEIQAHMRLRTSGDRHEIRQHYVPFIWSETAKRLQVEGKECIDEVIDLMDSYFLTKDDFDYIMELGLGPQNMENLSIDSQTKATFTRK